MADMQTLRRAHLLARFVLAWFVLAVGVAIASPVVKPQSMELICSGGGVMKLLVKSDDGSAAQSSHTLDCPLCATPGAPPPALQAGATLAPPSAGVQPVLAVSPRISRPAAPLPARGPPASA